MSKKAAPEEMDELDRAILNCIQSNFPITKRPYLEIARQTGLDEDTVVARVAALKERGIIRRMGGNFSPEKLGFVSTLCAARVPEEKIALFAKTVNRFQGVTHNYLRKNDYNVWFTFIAPSADEIASNLKAIARETGVEDILNLPATRVFKIRALFHV
jgi:DNA-binding Lrp family transcriptional regulator